MLNEQPTVYNVFEKELALIKDADVKGFVIDTFGEMCPQYFWFVSASVTSPRHPPICKISGGLVQHTKLAVTWADTFLDMAGIAERDHRYSRVIAAILLHDMMKRGATEDALETFGTHKNATLSHGRYCAEQISIFMSVDSSTDILRAIALHMGRWTQDVTGPELYRLQHNDVIRITHLADYAASRPLHHYLAERHMDPTMEYLRQ